MFEAINILPPKRIGTPFGNIETPALEIPPVAVPHLNDQRRQALGHSLGVDASDLLAFIPYLEGLAADSIRAMHTTEIRRILSPTEYNTYLRYDKQYPDTLAMLRTFIGR